MVVLQLAKRVAFVCLLVVEVLFLNKSGGCAFYLMHWTLLFGLKGLLWGLV